MKNSYFSTVALGVLVTSIAVTGQPLVASAAIDELIVTSRKREENLQDVPVAVTAFTADDFAKQNMNSLEDVAAFTAGFSFESFGSGAFTAPIIRGQAQTRLQNSTQNVSTFLDGIYIQRQYMIDSGLLGVERLEVVKGPQNALYGRNAFAGAVNYITKKPSDAFEVGGSVTIGNDERLDYSAYVGGPIVEDKLKGRLEIGKSEFDGTWSNNHPDADAGISPGTDGNLGGWDNDAISASLNFTPTDALDFNVSYYKTDKELEASGGYSAKQVANGGVNNLNCSPTGFAGNELWCGELPNMPILDPAETRTPGIGIDPRAYTNTESEIWTANARWSINDQFDIFYQYGRVEGEIVSFGSNDRDHAVGNLLFGGSVFDAVEEGAYESDSHEFRVEYDNGSNVNAMAGIYLADVEDVFADGFLVATPLDNTPITTVLQRIAPTLGGNRSIPLLEDEILAVFAQLGLDISDSLRLNLEGRYTEEDRKASDSVSLLSESEKFDYFTPKVVLEYSLSDDSLFYGSIAKGVKAGGFNIGANDPTKLAYDPEENWTYEIGSKNTFLDGRLTMNAAAFFIDWSDLQINVPDIATLSDPFPPLVVGNFGGAEVWGFELEGAFAATDNLTFDYAVSYSDPEYKDGTTSEAIVRYELCDNVVCSADGDISGNTIQRTPKTQAAVGATYEGDLANGLGYFVHADATYQSKQYLTEMNVGYIPSRTLLNASAGITSENWGVRLWVKNLADEKYVSNSFVVTGGVPVFSNYHASLGQKRTFGLTVDVNF